jgi:hypothetical protein
MLSLQKALSNTHNEATMMLAEDGGYVMIGVPLPTDSRVSSPPPYFDDVEWSTGINSEML